MINQENRPFLTIKEVSEMLGISVSTINHLIKRGDFPLKVKISPRNGFYEIPNSGMGR